MPVTAQNAKSHENALKLHELLAWVNIDEVPVMSNDRHIARKEQARLARELFKFLGVKGISITTPNYSMAHVVNVSFPRRQDYDFEADGSIDCNSAAAIANRAAVDHIESILAVAFPNHDDRSDTRTDYYDYCWSVNG